MFNFYPYKHNQLSYSCKDKQIMMKINNATQTKLSRRISMKHLFKYFIFFSLCISLQSCTLFQSKSSPDNQDKISFPIDQAVSTQSGNNLAWPAAYMNPLPEIGSVAVISESGSTQCTVMVKQIDLNIFNTYIEEVRRAGYGVMTQLDKDELVIVEGIHSNGSKATFTYDGINDVLIIEHNK